MDNDMSTLKTDNAELLERVLELERYKHKWNLKIWGMKEEEDEDRLEKVVRLLEKLID